MFSLKLSQTLARNLRTVLNQTSINHAKYSWTVYEPDYLDCFKPDTPIHETINIQLKGYDFPQLENFQKQIHRVIDIMDLEAAECWATPPQHISVTRYKPNSSVTESEYRFPIYERNIQMDNLSSVDYPILLRIVQEMAPEGVTVTVHKALPEHTEIRYVPDNELLSLKQQLIDMGGPTKDKKKKKK